jgi:tetratricopeptide (TPR) repeat protein
MSDDAALSTALENSVAAQDREHTKQALRLLFSKPDVILPRELLERAADFMRQQGEYEIACQTYQIAIPQAGSEFAARLWFQVAATRLQQGHYYEVAQALEHGLGLAQSPLVQAELLIEKGWLLFRQDRLDEAEACYTSAQRLLPQESHELQARLFNRYAGIMYQRQALDALAEAGDLQGIANVFNNLGSIYQEQGAYDECIQQREEALRIFTRLGHTEGQGIALLNLAIAQMTLGRFADGSPYAERALELTRRNGLRFYEGAALSRLAYTHMNQGAPDKALMLLGEAERIFQELGSLTEWKESKLYEAEAHLLRGDLFEADFIVARLLNDEALAVHKQGFGWRIRAELHRRASNLLEAQDAITHSLALISPTREPYLYLLSELEQSMIIFSTGDRRSALDLQQGALQRWQHIARVSGTLPFRIVTRLFFG